MISCIAYNRSSANGWGTNQVKHLREQNQYNNDKSSQRP